MGDKAFPAGRCCSPSSSNYSDASDKDLLNFPPCFHPHLARLLWEAEKALIKHQTPNRHGIISAENLIG